jgi:hypothetical protein
MAEDVEPEAPHRMRCGIDAARPGIDVILMDVNLSQSMSSTECHLSG